MSTILTDDQLRQKLIDYNFLFNEKEFNLLKNLGFYHVFNSFVPKKIRQNRTNKQLIDYIHLYYLDAYMKKSIFPVIIEIESRIKQTYNSVVLSFLLKNNESKPFLKNWMKYCVCSNSANMVSTTKMIMKSVNHSNSIVNHHMTTFKEIPIWAYIEFLTLGDFILLLKNCNTSVKNGINLKFDLGLNNEILTNVLKPIKDIRNNIAHNQPIFDVRFNDTKYNERDITQLILSKNNIKDQTSFSFNDSHITDYIILIYTLAKHIFVDDEEEYMLSLKKLLSDIRDGNLKLSNKIIISKIFGDNYQDKISLFI